MNILTKLLHKKNTVRFMDNVFSNDHKKRCLILYIVFPFLSDKQNNSHQNIWQVRELARIISEKGYVVDVADFNVEKIDCHENYDLIIDLSPRDDPVYEHHMNSGCIRIAYITGSDPKFSNEQEKKRVDACNRRRKSNIVPRRQVGPISKNIEDFEAVFFIGNAYNLRTFEDYQFKKVVYLPNTGYELDEIERHPDDNGFLFLGSSGQVHKGLDLLLEVFSRKDCPFELYVCSPFIYEKDFVKTYRKELFHTKNIHAIGFLDVYGSRIRKIAARCSFVILPSCSEGQAGSICTGMSLGLIPICTPECGYGEDEVIMIHDVGCEGLYNLICKCGNMDNEKIVELRERSWRLSREKHGNRSYTDAVNRALDEILQCGAYDRI